MKSKIYSLLLLATVILMGSCADMQSAADDTLKSIPTDVSMVTAIDADAILEKADFENVKTMAFYQELIEETKRYNATLGEVVADPQKSGIDLSKNIYIAHHFEPENVEEVFVGIVASVKDKAALETLIQSNSKFKISEQTNYKLAMRGSQSVAWNDEKVVLGMTNSYNDPVMNMDKFFNTTEETSIAQDANLKKAFSGNHDITSWVSSNAIATSASLKNALIMASIDPEAIKDNFIHSYVDFKKGEIEAKSDLYLQSALMEDINLIFKDNVTTDFSGYIPAKANSVMAVSLDFEGVQQILQKRPQVMMMADFGLKEYGLSVSDIANTFGGDILLYSTPAQDEKTMGSFATNVNDSEKLNKFLSLATDYNVLTKVDDNTYSINGTGMLTGGFGNPEAQLIVQDDMIFISGDPEIVSTIKSGGFSGGDKMDKSKIKMMRKNILSGFVDYSEMMKNIPEAKDLELNFEDMNFSTTRKESNFNMNFKDKKSNGLKQLFESINEIYLADKKDSI